MNATQAKSHPSKSEAMSLEDGFYYQLDRADMAKYVPPRARRVLDIGCGAGRFGQLLKEQRGLEAWGIELNPQAARLAASVLDEVRTGTFEEHLKDLPKAHFDCISFNDVLEHMADPFAVLTQVQALLVPQGVVLASLPNIRFFRAIKHIVWDGDFCYCEHGIFDRTHLRFFTKKSIVRTFQEAGYELVALEGLHPETPAGPVLRTALRLLQRLMPKFRDMNFLQFAVVARRHRKA